ncbi:MAG: adenylyl-sulfate kinase [Phycisphaerae bacterium]|nr:adenylyl-sulfate kinase [Phycisphaerae bacterium]
MADNVPQSQQAFTVLLTGLPGSGKSTLAAIVAGALARLGRRVQVLDGEQVRATLSRDLGFSRDDRRRQAERLAFLADLLNSHGIDVLIPAITPYAEDRAIIAGQIERFGEIAVVCDMATCRQRDTEGLYERADAGAIDQFTGVSAPYEAPTAPMAAVINDIGSPEQGAMTLLQALESAGWISGVASLDLSGDVAYSEDDEAEITRRLTDLGYL